MRTFEYFKNNKLRKTHLNLLKGLKFCSDEERF